MNTYYHFRGFIYGPCTQLKPERKPEWNPYQWDSWFGLFTEYTMQKPKYKWTGPPLEDWKEMIEGKDFELKTGAKADESGWISTKAITK